MCADFVEANALAPNWGQTIFQSAHEIAANTILRKRLDEIQSQTQAEREWWERRRTSIQTDFLRELDSGSSGVAKAAVPVTKNIIDEDTVLVEGGGPTANEKGSTRKKKAKK
jgi:translocation protein SEC66